MRVIGINFLVLISKWLVLHSNLSVINKVDLSLQIH